VALPEELHRRGRAELNSGRYVRARDLLQRARSAAADPDLRSRVELSLAALWAETGEPDAAEQLCREALLRSGLTGETVGLLHSQLGLLLMLRGQTEQSLAEFARAVGTLTDPIMLGRARLNRGNVYLQQGQTDRAHDDFARAEELFAQVGDAALAAKAGHNLGYTRFLRGDLVGALRSMDTAYRVLVDESPVMRAMMGQDRAETLIAAGLVTEGRTALREVARAYNSRRLHQRQGDAELALARTLVLTDPEGALTAARTARRLYVRTGSVAWRARAEAVALAAEVELGRRGPSLVTRGDALGDELAGQGLVAASTLVRLHAARVLVRRRELTAASERLRRIRLGRSDPLAVRLLLRTARTELASAQGRRSAALQQVAQGVSELHAWQSSFGSLDLQTAVVGQGRRLAVLGLGIAVDSARAEVVYEWSERGRMLASRILPVRPPADERTAADLAELRRIHAGSDGIQVPAPRRDAELRRRVRERAWQNKGSGEVTEPAPLAAVREALGRDTALVAWVISGDRLVALVVTDAGEGVHELGSASRAKELLAGLLPDLDMAASELPDSLAVAVRRGLVGRLAELDRLLVDPLLPALGDRAVVATPSGGLAGLPWPLLPGLVGRPVTVATSATAWLAGRRDTTALRRAGFVAGPRVERAEAEVTGAAAGWPGATCLTGAEATAAAVSELARAVDVLHVAAHGRHSADNPLFSGLELVDGPWFGYDIDLLPRVPQVVVLSACEVGRSSVRFGEELIGMTAAWLHAGVRCVVASPSAVNDAVAHDVLTALHGGLARGLDPAAALAAAVPAVAIDSPTAPFVCFGSAG